MPAVMIGIWADGREQRCRLHKIVNAFGTLAKSVLLDRKALGGDLGHAQYKWSAPGTGVV